MDEIHVNIDKVRLIAKATSPINHKDVIEVMRSLRNSCVNNPEVQNIIALRDFLEDVRNILSSINIQDEDAGLCSLVTLQCLANVMVNNSENQLKVWLECREIILKGLTTTHPKIKSCCAMILYNVYLGHAELLEEFQSLFGVLLDLAMEKEASEFVLFTLELLISRSSVVETQFEHLKEEQKFVVMDIVTSMVEEKKVIVNSQTVLFFVDRFNKFSDKILQTVPITTENVAPVAVVKTLSLLVAVSSDNKAPYLQILQDCRSLLINCVYLLKSIHNISKEAGNNFTMIQKVSELLVLEADNLDIESHPSFGLKCSLIRLIGNLCWDCEVNQDLIRELEGIALVLDCCNIDGRNPFIIQWAVLAVRNICHKNKDNQRVIAMLNKMGTIDTARMQELGLVLNTDADGSSIAISPLKKYS